MSDLRAWDSLHPETRKRISEVLEWHEQTNSGGRGCCVPHGDKWFICGYHEGYDDALEKAEVPAVQHVEADFDRMEAKVKHLRTRVDDLVRKNERLRDEVESLKAERLREVGKSFLSLRDENQRLKEEVRRLEGRDDG